MLLKNESKIFVLKPDFNITESTYFVKVDCPLDEGQLFQAGLSWRGRGNGSAPHVPHLLCGSSVVA